MHLFVVNAATTAVHTKRICECTLELSLSRRQTINWTKKRNILFLLFTWILETCRSDFGIRARNNDIIEIKGRERERDDDLFGNVEMFHFAALVMSLYPNAWQGPLSTSLFWRWLGLALALGLHGLVCTQYRVLGLATTLVLAVVPHLWLETRLSRRGKILAPLWRAGNSTASDRSSGKGRHRDWGRRAVPSRIRRFSIRRSNRGSSGQTSQQEQKAPAKASATTVKGKMRRRANSVAFACRTDYGLPVNDTSPKPSLFAEERRRSANDSTEMKERDRVAVFAISWANKCRFMFSLRVLPFSRL